jgi:hypothetical protein
MFNQTQQPNDIKESISNLIIPIKSIRPKNPFSFSKIVISLSIIVLSLFTITSTVNSKASDEVQFNKELISNPQAFLNVVFKDNIHLDNIVENELHSIKNNQGYEIDNKTFVINSMSGLSNIAGTEQRISIQGNNSTNTLVDKYHDKLSEVITKLDDLKNNNSKIDNLSEEDRTKLDHQLSKMNPIELKAQRYWNWGDDKVLSMSIIGNTETLYDIKGILEDSGHTTNVTITETAVIQKQIEEINKAVEGMSDEEKQAYVQNLYSELITKELAKLGFIGNLEDYMKQEMDKAPEYVKEAVDNILQYHQTESVETNSNKIFTGLTNGTKANAALPLWMTSVTAMAITISHYTAVAFFWVIRYCSTKFKECALTFYAICSGINDIDDMRRKIFN